MSSRVQKAMSLPIPWAWNELAQLRPASADVAQVLEEVPYGSSAHTRYAKKISRELNMKKTVHYHFLVKLLANCISGITEVHDEQ